MNRTINLKNILLHSNKITNNKKKHIKLTQNQLYILDTLLNDGGTKQYIDKQNNLRYSEHSGMFDIANKKIDKIIISATTNREDKDDIEILLPRTDNYDMKYEYIFHTHPPTPYAGARSNEGVLYEFPSINDLYHYAYRYNEGEILGSIVLAPEGMYLIRIKNNIKYIDYPSVKNEKKMHKISSKINDIAIMKYGTDFYSSKQQKFYEEVSQDMLYIKKYNNMVKKYFNKNMVVDYYPRIYNRKTGKWDLQPILLEIKNKNK